MAQAEEERTQPSPEVYRTRILDAVDFVIADGLSAYDTIEPLAGFFWPRVNREINTELRLRGREDLCI